MFCDKFRMRLSIGFALGTKAFAILRVAVSFFDKPPVPVAHMLRPHSFKPARAMVPVLRASICAALVWIPFLPRLDVVQAFRSCLHLFTFLFSSSINFSSLATPSDRHLAHRSASIQSVL